MGSGLDESTSSKTTNDDNDAGDFECNICFDLAQDPIITLCGHLFCWPCLYRWLHYHSQSQECPVCKALVQEDKLVPLYGRGKSSSDPRTRPIHGFEIPNRPSGQRPETAPPPVGADQRFFPNFGNFGFGMLGGFMPMTTARFGNFTMSAGFGGLFPAMMSFQFNGFPDSSMYGAAHGHGHGLHNGFGRPVHGHGIHNGHGHGHVHGHGHGHVHGHGFQNHPQGSSQRQDVLLKNLLMIVGFLVLLSFIFT